jgi:acyl-CoA dehydrogenase
MTRCLMIFGQGAIRCHPYVLKEMQASRLPDPAEALTEFDKLLFSHVGYSISNAVRSFLLGFTRGHLARIPVPKDRRLASYYRKLTRYSAALAFSADVSMLTLGGKLKQKERLSARLGDVLSQLYICSAMLRRFEAQDRPASDQPILAWAFHDAIFKIQTALGGAVDNFPNKYMRILLNLVVFPTGRREREPGDRLSHRVTQLLLSPSATRDRLTNGIYVSDASGHPIGLMESALPKVIAAEPLERKLLKAQRAGRLDAITWDEQLDQAVNQSIVTADEAESLREVREQVLEIIAVDEFESEVLQLGKPARQAPIQTPEAA